MRIWVTGAAGSIGQQMMERLPNAVGSDREIDVRHFNDLLTFDRAFGPFDVIVHCAGAKHAPEGETNPDLIADVNIHGTRNILKLGAKVVLASTCKAADPETVYGASKLIAERMVLNAGGVVARYYNVAETSGNVFELWRNTDGPIPVTECWRYFITLKQAVDLTELCIDLPSGRYTVDPGPAQYMPDVATRLYPDRPQQVIPPRRGDRIREPRHAQSETLIPIPNLGIERIEGKHDPC